MPQAESPLKKDAASIPQVSLVPMVEQQERSLDCIQRFWPPQPSNCAEANDNKNISPMTA